MLSCLLGTPPLLSGPAAARAQEIPRGGYLRFVPLHYPRITASTPASRDFQLFGDPDAPDYRDADPRDGIDDARHERLLELAIRFSPFLVRNTSAVPMDFKKFMEPRSAFPLHVDSWDVSKPAGELVDGHTVNLGAHSRSDDDRALLELLYEFHPARPGSDYYRDAVVPPGRRLFKVLYFDFPGGSPSEWKREYESLISGRLRRSYRSYQKIYCHPFLREVRLPRRGVEGYELVLQYWFFYPFNDGGNNHEGDWEHVNVVIAAREDRTTVLPPERIRAILEPSEGRSGLPPGLVIGRVDYYFHHKVMTLDFLRPDVYQPRKAWKREIRELDGERMGERWIWERIREMAYTDPAETEVNTHPVGYIGADNKGLDQLLTLPGGTNRDSHGTYPFPGLYKDIGAAAAAEEINASPNPHHRAYRRSGELPPGLERFDDPGKIEILPDWERVGRLVMDEPAARREWSWLLLPIRWGYPAVRSPFAGVVSHAETGNLAPFGPAYNSGWNRVGGTIGFDPYEPHKFGGTLPLGWQDSFVNSWGFLNLTLPTLVVLPPFDFAWRVVLFPVRAPIQARHPTFFPRETVPFRLIGGGGGVSVAFLPNEFTLLFTAPEILDQLEPVLGETPEAGAVADELVSSPVAPVVSMQFHIGDRLVSQSSLRHVEGRIGIDLRSPEAAGLTPVRGTLELWEYSGSLRYNLSTGTLQPFVKAGYGLSWYRLRETALGGVRLEPAETAWVRRPSLVPLENLLPNTWHAGVGLEAVPIRNFGGFPGGLDVGLKASWAVYAHGLGLGRPEVLSEQEDVTLRRSYLDLSLTVSF